MSTTAFKVTNVHKHFGKVKALDGVTLSCNQGKIFGLLGPNGAGKTTLVRMLSTLITPDEGTATVLDHNVADEPQKIREAIGLAGQFAAIDEYLTGYENIYMVGKLYHLTNKEAAIRTKQILKDLRLDDAQKRLAKTYSGGMRRRLDLGASLIGNPRVLFLDEPTTGLDPRSRLDMWQIIRKLASEGTTVLLTTQYLEEADELADTIAVLDHGKVIAQGTSDQLKTKFGGDVVQFSVENKEHVEKAIKLVIPISKGKPIIEEDGLTITVPVKNNTKGLLEIVDSLNKAKITPTSLALKRPSLDDVFLALTGKKTEAVEAPAKKPRMMS